MGSPVPERLKPLLESVRPLAERFDAAGFKLYLVGGVVRDAVLGRPLFQDLDFTTDARPEDTLRLVEDWADSVWTQGQRFGTIGFQKDGHRYEVTTHRGEAYHPDSRKPDVVFASAVEEDLARRDFTVNAMARPAAGGDIVDPFDGQVDLAARTLRAVGDPDERFAEDPLRLLRAVRIAAQFGFRIEPATRDSVLRNADALRTISTERIVQELNRILLTPRPSRPIRELCDLGLMRHIVPEFLELRSDGSPGRHKDNFEHTLIFGIRNDESVARHKIHEPLKSKFDLI